MQQVTKNKVVTFNYTLKTKDSEEVVDSSEMHGQPLKAIFGIGLLIPGLEARMEGMTVGERKIIEVPANEAYGERKLELIRKEPKEYFQGIELQKGMTLQGQTQTGEIINLIVVDFDDETVTVDFNHPLAGKDLVFDVEILEIRDASPEELTHGHVHN